MGFCVCNVQSGIPLCSNSKIFGCIPSSNPPFFPPVCIPFPLSTCLKCVERESPNPGEGSDPPTCSVGTGLLGLPAPPWVPRTILCLPSTSFLPKKVPPGWPPAQSPLSSDELHLRLLTGLAMAPAHALEVADVAQRLGWAEPDPEGPVQDRLAELQDGALRRLWSFTGEPIGLRGSRVWFGLGLKLVCTSLCGRRRPNISRQFQDCPIFSGPF